MRHRRIVVAVAGLLALGLVEEMGAGAGRVLAVHRASALLTAVPGLSVGRVSAHDGVLAIEGLDYAAASGARFHVGSLTLPAGTAGFPGLVGTAAADPAGIVATDVSITIRHNVIAMPRIEAQGTYLMADRLRALLDPSTGSSVADRLKDLTAASLTAPTMTITTPSSATGTDGGKVTLDDVALTDVVEGRIGAVSIRRTTVVDTATTGAPAVATLGPVAIDGLDLPLADRIVETGRNDPAEPPGAIYGSLSVRDVAIAPDGTGSLRIGTIAASGFRGRPLLRRPADIVALLDKPSGSQTPDDVQALADIAVDAAKGFSLDHLEWGDATLATKGADAALLTLGRIAMDGLTPSRIGTWVLADLAFTSDQASVTLGRLALRGPDESRLVEILAHQLATSGLAMDRTRLMSGVPQDGSLSMVGLHLEAPSGDQPGNGPDGHRYVFDVPVVSFASATDAVTKVATTTAHMRATFALPPGSANPGFAALAGNGFTGLDARADYRMTFDPKGQEIRLEPLAIAVEKLGRVSISVDVGNVPFDLLASGSPSSDAQAALDRVVFKGFTLDLGNDGIVQMALPIFAASANQSVPMLKAVAKTQSDLLIGQMLGGTPAAARLTAAIDAFIDDPKTFHLAVTAPVGLTGAEIQAAADPKSLLDRVGIEATANR